MPNIILENISENRDKWLELRRKSIGSSEIPVICGLSKWQSPLQLWREKTGRDKPKEDNEYMRLGRHMEPFIGSLWASRTGRQVKPANALFRNANTDFAVASPDFFALDAEEIVETKNRNANMAAKYDEGTCLPSDHLQLMWQLGVLGFKKGHVAALCGGDPKQFYAVEVEFEPAIFDQALAMADRFWHHVKTDTEPPATALDKEILSTIERDANKLIALDDEAGVLFESHKQAEENIEKLKGLLDPWEKQKKDAESRLLQLMGSAATGTWGRYTIAAKKIERKAYEVKASSYTRLTIKEG